MNKVRSWSYQEKPVWQHNCTRCKFIIAINFFNEKNEIIGSADIYENCNSIRRVTDFLIRFSSEGSDYATLGQNILFAHYVIDNQGWR